MKGPKGLYSTSMAEGRLKGLNVNEYTYHRNAVL